MSHVCLRDEDLAATAERLDCGADGQEWLRCARCRARLTSFREFRDPAHLPTDCRAEEADLRLAAVFDAPSRPGRLEESDASVQHALRTGSAGQRALRKTWQGRQRILRLAWAAAATAVIVWAGHEVGVFERRAGNEIQLREEGDSGHPELQTSAPVREADGAVQLSWGAVPGAERYDVMIHGVDLLEILRLDAGSELSVRLTANDADRICSAPGSCFWRVTAFREGEKIAQSRIRPLNLPQAP